MEPNELRIGDTLTWGKSVADYLASDGWELNYALRGPTGVINIVFGTEITADGDDFTINVPAATSAGYTAGEYAWTSFVEKGADRYTIESGFVTVLADLVAAVAGYDGRSHVKKTLDALESLIEGKASKDVEEYTIEGRSLKRMNVDEILKWRDKYLAFYKAEIKEAKIAKGLKVQSNKVRVRF